MLKVGFIGFGEAGEIFARHLSDRSEVKVYDQAFAREPLPWELKRRLERAEVAVHSTLEQVVRGSSLIFSLVTPMASSRAALETALLISPKALFLDLNSVPPTVKERCAREFPGDGTGYVDGAILGSVFLEGHKVPIALSGERASEAADLLASLGMAPRHIGSKVGAASAIKICRSVVMKGLECLMIEALLAAEEYGVGERVLESVGETLTSRPFQEVAEMLVVTHIPHAERRAGEMAGISEALESLGIPPIMSEAARRRLELSVRCCLEQGTRATMGEALRALKAKV